MTTSPLVIQNRPICGDTTGDDRMNFQVKHLLKKGKLWFYYRRVPEDLRAHYDGKQFIRLSLRTHDLPTATQACERLTQEHDALWQVLRSDEGGDLTKEQIRTSAEKLLALWGAKRFELNAFEPGPKDKPAVKQKIEGYFEKKYRSGDVPSLIEKGKLSEAELEAFALLADNPKHVPLSEARDFYLSEHANGQNPRFRTKVTTDIKSAIDVISDKPLIQLSRDDARKVRDSLMGTRKTATVRRILSVISAVVNFTIREKGLDCRNPFEAVKIAGEGRDSETRDPFTREELLTISGAAFVKNDDRAWIAALQVETGLRMSEAALLRVEDIHLDGGPIPYIDIKEHFEHGRGLKTGDISARLVPLQGCALWAVRQALAHAGGSQWLFPRVGESQKPDRADLATERVNGWIRSLGIDRTSHCFRHAMIDRLLNADISEKLAMRLTGHAKGTIHDKYGSGFTLQKYADALAKVVLPFESPLSATITFKENSKHL
jgi:integrase